MRRRKQKRKRFKLYQKHPVHGKIPNWKQVIRCHCCATIYAAKPLQPQNVDDLFMMDEEHYPYPARTINIPYAECPKCYGWFAAEFSTS